MFSRKFVAVSWLWIYVAVFVSAIAREDLALNNLSNLEGSSYSDDNDDDYTGTSGKSSRNSDENDQNSEQKHYIIEGDIELRNRPEPNEPSNAKRSLRRSQEYLWIDRVVPYEIAPKLAEVRKGDILEAMRRIQNKSCISFVERTNEKHWIKFERKGGCYSGVGRQFWTEGPQTISLGHGCLKIGIIMHEILHSLGFWHEQSRQDRDQYIEILWENIGSGEQHNFAKHSISGADDLKSNYDYTSIMHYGRFSFSRNNKPTILAIIDKNKELGQRDHLSAGDVIKLNFLYRCKDIENIYSSWSEWSPCDTDCEKARQRFCSNYNEKKCPEASHFGVHTERTKCSIVECTKPVNGHWGKWGSWSECSKSCGIGQRTRKRECDDPKSKHGGRRCRGFDKQKEKCLVMPCGYHPDDCLFDSQKMCYWRDVSRSRKNYRWQRIKGKTPSTKTGPDSDHTTSSKKSKQFKHDFTDELERELNFPQEEDYMDFQQPGFYMYAEASGPAAPGNKASLVSKRFPAVNHRCMTFFYSMYGLGVGALRVFIIVEDTIYEKKVWEKTGNQGKGWKEAEVEISSKYVYRIQFEAERGPSFLGDIALDDIHFRDSKCLRKNRISLMPAPKTVPMDAISKVCNVRIKALGCFGDSGDQHSLPIFLRTDRSRLNWKKYNKSLKKLTCKCLQLAQKKALKYVGLQFYGECYGGNGPAADDRYGKSENCVNSKFEACTKPNRQHLCIGGEDTNYIYEIIYQL